MFINNETNLSDTFSQVTLNRNKFSLTQMVTLTPMKNDTQVQFVNTIITGLTFKHCIITYKIMTHALELRSKSE